MRRTALIAALALASLGAAALAAAFIPRNRPPPQGGTAAPGSGPGAPPLVVTSGEGPLRLSAQLARRWLDARGSAQYLQIDVSAEGAAARVGKAAVNAVLVVDRSGSMAGAKIEKAREAARALIAALDGEDRLAIVDFASDATVLLASAPMTAARKEEAGALVSRLHATTGTNLSAAIDLAAPQLAAGRGQGRVDRVFLASDGQANEGIYERSALQRLVRNRLEGATVATFGVGDDYDEDLMTALAVQSGGRARYIERPEDLPPAIATDLSRAAQAVARGVRLEVHGLSGARVERVFGFRAEADGSFRLPDFSAGETRRVLVKLQIPQGRGEAQLARVEVRCQDLAGAAHAARADAGGSFTAEARLLSVEPGEAQLWGARAEMAEVAQAAVQLQEQGRAAEAKQKEAEISAVAADLALAKPAAAPQAAGMARGWLQSIDASAGGAPAARKAAKQRAYEAASAPVAEW